MIKDALDADQPDCGEENEECSFKEEGGMIKVIFSSSFQHFYDITILESKLC